MATTEIVNLTDDLNPEITEGVQTVTFFDPATGEKREIELGEGNRELLADYTSYFATFVEASRPIEVKKPKPVKNDENVKIREWAQANGYTIGDRGRIKADIVDAYRKAQEAKASPDTDAQAASDESVSKSKPARKQGKKAQPPREVPVNVVSDAFPIPAPTLTEDEQAKADALASIQAELDAEAKSE